MEGVELLPQIVVRVNIACDKGYCARNLKKALLELDGVYKVDILPEDQKVDIRSTLDPFMIIKEIVMMDKSAELVFYDKEPTVENHQYRNTKSSEEKSFHKDEHKQNTRSKGKEKCHCCPEDRDTRNKEDGYFESDNDYWPRETSSNFPEYQDRRKKEANHNTSDHYRTRNFRERNQERSSYHQNYDFPDNARGNRGPEKYSRCRNYDRNYGPSEDKKIPRMFSDDEVDGFEEFNSRHRGASWGRHNKPSMDDEPHHFRSKSGRYDRFPSAPHHSSTRPPYGQFDPYMPPPEQFGPHMPPPEQFGPRMPPPEHFGPTMRPPYDSYVPSMQPQPPQAFPYYSDFGLEDPGDCSIM